MNVALRLREVALANPDGPAVVEQRAHRAGKFHYRSITFRQLDEDSSRIACQLCARGVEQGDRLVLLVPPGINFVTLVFALLKSGATMVLIDPGMGRRHLIRCLSEVPARRVCSRTPRPTRPLNLSSPLSRR